MCIIGIYIGGLMEYISKKVAAYGQFVLVFILIPNITRFSWLQTFESYIWFCQDVWLDLVQPERRGKLRGDHQEHYVHRLPGNSSRIIIVSYKNAFNQWWIFLIKLVTLVFASYKSVFALNLKGFAFNMLFYACINHFLYSRMPHKMTQNFLRSYRWGPLRSLSTK